MLRKLTVIASVIYVLCTSMMITYGSDNMPISIYVNQKEINTDVGAYLDKGTTFVPLRAICNAMGVTDVQWEGESKKVTVKGYSKIELYIGDKIAYVNGERREMPESAVIKNDRTMVPARFVAESCDARVDWNETLHTVEITKTGVVVPSYCVANNYTSDDVLWLSRIVHAESRGEPLNGQTAVANVVLNRVKSRDFPNTVYGVIFDRNYGVQFQPVANGSIYNTPSKKSVVAAKKAVNGENNIGNCLYFLNPKTATNFWIVNNRKYFTTINNHQFYL